MVVQVWSWDDGVVLGVGKGHSGTINKVRAAPMAGQDAVSPRVGRLTSRILPRLLCV